MHHLNEHLPLHGFFFFLLIAYYLHVFYIYFRLGKWCQTNSKLEGFSYLSSEWVIKQRRQLTTSTKHLAQELLTNVQCSGGSRSFGKEESLEDEDHSGEPLEVDNDQLRAIVKADLLRTTEEVAEELSADHSTVTGHFCSKLES